ncbi:hypothetical protein [Amycolatopsis sp. CB00013]|uniref:hypothetical protein n=1 Tax=Amycolatopsis sp. CB00013 TaxID=1703945 RepID=UPI001160EEB0|nr:hypothetical protein [Amycolatopsis sp. CB00013]
MEVLSTGIVAALASTYLLRWTQQSGLNIESIKADFKKIPRAAIDATVKYASKYRVDRDLAMTVLLVEYTQRPAWIRKAEPLLNKIGASSTTGIFQANKRVEKSLSAQIEPAISKLANTTLPRSHGYNPKQALLLASFEKHNRSKEFLAHATTIFDIVSQNTTPTCQRVAADGSPAIRRLGERRDGVTWTIWGDAASEIHVLSAISRDCENQQAPGIERQVQHSVGRYRPIWKVQFDLPHDTLIVQAQNSLGEYASDLTLTINPSPFS